MRAIRLKADQLKNPIGIDVVSPLLSWVCESDKGDRKQTAFEVTIKANGNEVYNSGKVAAGRMNLRPDYKAASKQRLTWQVRLWNENDTPGDWSEEAYYETGILDQKNFVAKWITAEVSEAASGDAEGSADGAKAPGGFDLSSIDPEEFERLKKKYAAMAMGGEAAGNAPAGQAQAPQTPSAPSKAEEEPVKTMAPKNPVTYLKKKFEMGKPENARLYITAHGLYEAYINGQRVGNFVLAPGTSDYNKHMPYQVYDVTDLLVVGENKVVVMLGDGWYRSVSGVDGDRNLYGEDCSLYFQLENNGQVVLISDETWEGSSEGPYREADMQQGEVYDANKEMAMNIDYAFLPMVSMLWHPVEVIGFDVPFFSNNSLPIVERERFEGRLFTTPNGGQVIDYGQNIAGYIEFTLNAHAGQKIVMYHGEALDENGNFQNENFNDRVRHKEGGTYQRVEYICKEGENHYKSKFTIWGFQFASVETDIDLANADAHFEAIAVYSDMAQLATFESSDKRLEKLFSNCMWSQKGNFCDVPTDCPTRERAGWTGDAGIFVDTGITLMDAYPVFRKWLGECRVDQLPDGKVKNIAPPNGPGSFFSGLLAASTAWGDASIIVPYTLYKRTGDTQVLIENYDMMQKWYDYLISRAQDKSRGTQFEDDDPNKFYTIESGLDYGEWCEWGVDSQAAMSGPNKKVATAFLSFSGRWLSEIAAVLGDEENAAKYADIAEHAAAAFRNVALENGKVVSTHQADYIRPIAMGLVDDETARVLASDLNDMVVANDYHLSTGFLTTPFLCQVLADYGYVDTAYRVLLQDTIPGWLYEVKVGATTIWENWDGINEAGQVKASLNHYSYGAISGWMIKSVAGIQMTMDGIIIAPVPSPLLGSAKASYDSPVGLITSGWAYDGDRVSYEIEIPANCTATVRLPGMDEMKLEAGRYTF